MKIPCAVLLAVFFLNAAHGATFTVTNTANSGPGTLRQAILDANANPGLDTINFNLPGSGVQTIAPTNALPAITNAVFIDGFSQPGSSANTSATGDNSVHLIRLDGYKCRDSFPSGLNFNTAYVFAASAASGSTVRGLCIVRFYHGISATEVSSLTVSGNWIGLDVDGIARGNGGNGVNITASFSLSQSNMIGGSTAAARNVISGNGKGVFFFTGNVANSLVQGNFIGTDQTGTLPRGNSSAGVLLQSCTNITVGGATSATRNVISGTISAGGVGINVLGSPNCMIQGNYIGTDVSGQYDLGNVSDGVYVNGSTGTRIIGNLSANTRAHGGNL